MEIQTELFISVFDCFEIPPMGFLISVFSPVFKQFFTNFLKLLIKNKGLFPMSKGIESRHHSPFLSPKFSGRSECKNPIFVRSGQVGWMIDRRKMFYRGCCNLLCEMSGIGSDKMGLLMVVNKSYVVFAVHPLIQNNGQPLLVRIEFRQHSKHFLYYSPENFGVMLIAWINPVKKGKLRKTIHQESQADLSQMAFTCFVFSSPCKE